MSLRELCHCGHDRLSHAPAAPGEPRGACLAVGCDECRQYVNEFDPPPPAPAKKRRWGHPKTCQCFDCRKIPPSTPAPRDTPVVPSATPTDPWGLP